MTRPIRDLTNQVFGSLTAVETIKKHGSIKIVWKCTCICDRNTCPKIVFANSGDLRNGRVKSCQGQQYDKSIHLAIRLYFSKIRTSALKRNYVFELTLDQFIGLIQQPCKYCNANDDIKRMAQSSKPRWALRCNGIDRWDNTMGYIYENCVPCCARCNRAKDDMSGYEYINHCRKVTKHNE